MYYLQFVDGLRPDLFGLFPLIAADPHMAHVVSVVAYALETTHKVYLVKPMDGLEIKFQLQPEGRLVRVLGPQPEVPDHTLVHEAAGIRFVGWSKVASTNSQTLTVALFWQAIGTNRPNMSTYIHVIDGAGQTVAQSDHRPGGDYYPPSPWFAGDSVRDVHDLRLPTDHQIATYRLVAGAYVTGAPALGELARFELGSVQATQ
jgi:hypothetical protein